MIPESADDGPAEEGEAPDSGGGEGPDGPGGREVLFVEDDPDGGRAAVAALIRNGVQVTLECSAESATAVALRRLAAGRPFDVIAFDLRHDPAGPTAVATLRAAGYAGRMVALADRVAGDSADAWRSAGCEAVLSRDVPSEVLPSALLR